jgi:hypothetical protein
MSTSNSLVTWPTFFTKIGITGLPSLFIALALVILPIQQGLSSFWNGYSALIAYLLLIPAVLVLTFRIKPILDKKILWVLIPLLVIWVMSLIQILPGIGNPDITIDIIYSSILLLFILLFTVAVLKGKDFIALLPYALFIYALSVFLTGLARQGFQSAGISSGYNTVGAFLTVGIFLLKGYWRILIPFILLSLVFTGCYWSIPVLLIVGIWKLVTLKEKSLALIIGFSAVVILLFAGMYYFTNPESFSKVWKLDIVSRGITELQSSRSFDDVVSTIGRTSLRNEPIIGAIKNTSILGYGWQPITTLNVVGNNQVGRYNDSIHNVPLMILDELGILAMLAWLFTMIYLMVKSKEYRAPLLAIFIFSCTGIYDFWWFNSLMVLFFVVIGLATAELIKTRELSNVEVFN